MHTGIRRSVIDKHLAVLISYPSVGESHVHHVAQVFIAFWHEEIAAGLCDDLRGILQRRHIHI